jgi:hypothetical protein
MLPLVKGLAIYSDEHKALPMSVVIEKLTQYEDEMIPRAFGWVEKSGGTSAMVRVADEACRSRKTIRID